MASSLQQGQNTIMDDEKENIASSAQGRSPINGIPPLPATLMIPPAPLTTCSSDTMSSVRSTEAQRNTATTNSNVLQDLQSQLSAREHELDRLRAELHQHEQSQKDSLQTMNTRTLEWPRGFPLAPQGLGSNVSMTTQSSSQRDLEVFMQKYREQTEDLRTRLRMTTELCAKQEAYYRDIVKELEERLHETIEGRDHILALRESEAASQLNLVKQLEAALLKQKQSAADKDQTISCLETRVKEYEECNVGYTSAISHLRHVVQDQVVKRGRGELILGSSGPKPELLVQELQKCLFEDESEKQLLKARLEKLEYDIQSSKSDSQTKMEKLSNDYEARITNLKDDHSKALDIAASRSASARDDLDQLQQQLKHIKEQHITEISAMDDKMKSLRLELESVSKQKNDLSKQFETQSSTFENTSRETQVELNLIRKEKEQLQVSASREQANSIILQERLTSCEQELASERHRLQELMEEKKAFENVKSEEITKLNNEVREARSLLQQKEQEFYQQAEQEMRRVASEEQEKSNSRLNIILFEVNKLNVQVETLNRELAEKDSQLEELNKERTSLQEAIELRDREVSVVREEKIELATRYDDKAKELDQLKEDLLAKTGFAEEKSKELNSAQTQIEKLKAQLEEREWTIASFKEQGANLAQILERNNQTGDSLQRERQELIQNLQEQVREVQEMKRHREILAKKLKAKDKLVKDLEQQVQDLQQTVTVKGEEMAALLDDRENALSELKGRQMEVGKLREERDTLNTVLAGKDGEREKEISKLLSRLKGSEQDLNLTKRLLKAKGEMSGKAVLVAESMQEQITAKRGELDSLNNKIHWMQESLNAAIKDKRYFEAKTNKLSAELAQMTEDRDQLSFQAQQVREDCDGYRKQVKHLEQALEKAAIKHADTQAEIERLGQDNARLKLKHSLEIKELERNQRSSVKLDAATVAEILGRVTAGLRITPFSNQTDYNGTLPALQQPIVLQSMMGTPKETATSQPPVPVKSLSTMLQSTPAQVTPQSLIPEDHNELKSLLQDVRNMISAFQTQSQQPSASSLPSSDKRDNAQHDKQRMGTGANTRSESPVNFTETGQRYGQPSQTEANTRPQSPVDFTESGQRYGQPSQTGANTRPQSPPYFAQLTDDAHRDRYSETRPTRVNARPQSPPVYLDKNPQAKRLESPPVFDGTNSTGMPHYHEKGFDSDGSNFEYKIDSQSFDNFRPPLGSSSPKPDRQNSYGVSASGADEPDYLDDSISSLLSFHSAEPKVTTHARYPPKPASASSGTSGQRSTEVRHQAKSASSVEYGQDGRRQEKASSASSSASGQRSSGSRYRGKAGSASSGTSGQRSSTSRYTKDSETWGDKRTMGYHGGKSKVQKRERKLDNGSPPSYQRAELILKSLAQTGSQLTRKNKEIANLLNEQDRRIRKCRENENGIHSMLS
ncbi:coiled-coil domain-containing protein 158-like isoform X2 [Nematostella vectensis]|uniref:coiled-coil domain-containing protein 158-like isoform X2 n=1 Tax=Nematostella vectensis TaxID=45351 RepID=UPI00207756EA|nr:coiled-coil domain-containing protein 158-like isoform X2 [Nematostella vectensis]